ncbi:MAG TPA: RHS repeat-associated core domain-containing protein [Candidatus Obscuribacterales bacterium]
MKIVENGSGTPTRQFVWCGNQRCESRDASGNLLSQYFKLGQVNFSGSTPSNYYYTKDHLGSVREMTDSACTVQSQFSYDPYGTPTQIAGTGTTPDFGFAGMYLHTVTLSGSVYSQNLTMFRPYSPKLASWLSRDPLYVDNLYGYGANDPVGLVDILGLCPEDSPIYQTLNKVGLGWLAQSPNHVRNIGIGVAIGAGTLGGGLAAEGFGFGGGPVALAAEGAGGGAAGVGDVITWFRGTNAIEAEGAVADQAFDAAKLAQIQEETGLPEGLHLTQQQSTAESYMQLYNSGAQNGPALLRVEASASDFEVRIADQIE